MDVQTSPNHAKDPAIVTVDDGTVIISGLALTDPTVVAHLGSIHPEHRADELVRAIGIGLHGLATASMRATVEEMENRVRTIVAAAAAAAQSQLGDAVEMGRSELSNHLDPNVRSSLTARSIAELEKVHRETLAQLDPDRTDSHTAKLVAAITEMLGPGGQLAHRLADVFDSAEAERGMGRLLDTFEKRFREIRDLLVGEQQRLVEAERGTAKGLEFEDLVEEVLREEARGLSGCIVERTGLSAGTLGPDSKVGDFALTLADGTRIAVEAKNVSRISLSGGTGILAELDRAMDNRNASWSLCVSHHDAFPGEVGSFGVYGNRLLVVDPGDGVLIRVALRWIAAAARSASVEGEAIDTTGALEKLERIKGLAQHFSRSKKVLTNAQTGLETVRDELDLLRGELLDLVDDATRALRPAVSTARRVA